jgi:putative transposase
LSAIPTREGERPREPRQRTDSGLPVRHHPASGVFIRSLGPTIVFVTANTGDRKPWLASPAAHDAVTRVWREARAWLVGYYLLMPDHAHFFCAPGQLEVTLDRWMSYWKRLFTQAKACKGWEWQSGHWDTRLRRNENYQDKWRYVALNPVRKGLVGKTEDWPYQGVMNDLLW